MRRSPLLSLLVVYLLEMRRLLEFVRTHCEHRYYAFTARVHLREGKFL